MNDPLAPFEPTAQDPFDLAKVGHLLRRGGFQAALSERRRLVRAGLPAAMQYNYLYQCHTGHSVYW